ncbi:MAG TPA: hypothetical protein VGK33_08170, partial [Chloroflexota bacterium]
HGINPAMGWLFAVALGLQERKRSAVLKALPAIAVGHEASIAAVAAVIAVAQIFTAAEFLRPLGAIGLVAFGVFKLVKPRSHPRWVGLRVGPRDLIIWSFLMSSAHGAGLMLVPVLLGMPAPPDAVDLPGVYFSIATLAQDALAVTVHSVSMLLVMGTVAIVVYERLGLDVLRKAWLNVDLLWSVAVIAAGVVTLFT